MDIDVLNTIYKEVKNGKKAAMVVLTGNQKFSPGKEGAIMGVRADGSIIGTIGGGALEYEIIKQAKEAMKNNTDMKFEHDLSDKGTLNMACGGTSEGFIKVFYPNARLIIFGAGHVSQRLSRVAALTGFEVTVVDDREEFSEARDFENIESFIPKLPEDAVKDLEFDEDNTYIVICTRGHALDKDATLAVINKDYKYLGVIGSRMKITTLHSDLLEEGYDKNIVENIHMPLGLDIDDGSIEEIAISVLSELLAVKNGKEKIKFNKMF